MTYEHGHMSFDDERTRFGWKSVFSLKMALSNAMENIQGYKHYESLSG